MRRALLLAASVLCATTVTAAPPNICGTNATLGANVIAVLNLTYPGLEAVAAAAAAGDLNTACDELATYYKTSNTSWWLRQKAPVPGTGMAGGIVDAIVLHDVYYLAGVDTTAHVPRNADGGLDWLDRGPRNDDEFQNCLNRHDAFTYTLSAWIQTGNPIYPAYFDALWIDWVSHLPCPDALSAGTPCVPAGVPGNQCAWGASDAPGTQACKTGTMETPWRSLEMGIRLVGPWPAAFFAFQEAAEFTTSARALAILAVGEHNAALIVDGGHPDSGTTNWQIVQYQGLVASCVSWPELANCTSHLARALAELTTLLHTGVYPDGVENEQASGYDMSTAGDFFGTLRLLALGNATAPPDTFRDSVEAMWNYGAMVVDPRGCLPRNGDSDLCGSGYSSETAAYFNRPDWTYVKTNGAQGTVPPAAATDGPSSLFPWAGQISMRSGYDANATWLWFDVGPYGSSGHGHRDKLGMTLHARGSMLLVDSGRFAYAGTDLSATLHIEYARNTSAHNTMTIDSCDQLPLPALASAPVPNASVVFTRARDTAVGSMAFYNGLVGSAVHTRGMAYQRTPASIASGTFLDSDDGDYAVVVDAVDSDRPRALQTTWHAHPNSSGLALDAATGIAVVGGVAGGTGQPTTAQVCVVPATGALITRWDAAAVVRGRNASATAVWQGWYSQEYDDAWPASTLVYDVAAAPKLSYSAWLLVPTATRGPCDGHAAVLLDVAAGVAVLQVTLAGAPPVNVSVPISGA